MSSYAAVARRIDAAQRITITTHINPDGDGIGAGLALLAALEECGKQVRFLCPSPLASLYDFLPGFSRIEVIEDEAKAGRIKPCDVLIACDCGDLKRLGAAAALRRDCFINLDHHASNDRFGDENLVDTKAESTGVVAEKVLRRLGVGLDSVLATCFYTTIVFDTGRFMHSNTCAHTMRFAARLLDTGIDASWINRRLTYTKSLHDLAIQRLGIDHLVVDKREPRLAGIAIDAAAIKQVGAPEDWGELVEIPRSLAGNEVAYLLREAPDKSSVRCSLRANPPYAVEPTAAHFGGGGHLQAAGCTIAGDLAHAQRVLLPRLRSAFSLD